MSEDFKATVQKHSHCDDNDDDDDDEVAEPYDRMKSSVFNSRRNTGSDDDDVTIGGREFHARAAATGKDRSPNVG